MDKLKNNSQPVSNSIPIFNDGQSLADQKELNIDKTGKQERLFQELTRNWVPNKNKSPIHTACLKRQDKSGRKRHQRVTDLRKNKSSIPLMSSTPVRISSTPQELTDANIKLQPYGFDACLESFTNKKGMTRYRFVNVPPIENYPDYGFKSVSSAMRGLYAHEKGWVRNRKENKLRDTSFTGLLLKNQQEALFGFW